MNLRGAVTAGTAMTAAGTAAVAVAMPSARLPPPTFRRAQEWVTLTTGATNSAVVPPQSWAVTPTTDIDALRPFSLFSGLPLLSKDGIVIWATTAGRGGPTRVFTRARWPLRLSTFRVDHGWEGQPAPNVEQRLRWAWVRGWRLDVRVYFATQHPRPTIVRKAQRELNRLRLPR